MPHSIKAFTVEDNGFYNIFVNSRHCYHQIQESIKHELEHIKQLDFYRNGSIDITEKIRHG